MCLRWLGCRFVLLSEADIPLYHPLTFYQASLSLTKSRTKACASDIDNPERWLPEMEVRKP